MLSSTLSVHRSTSVVTRWVNIIHCPVKEWILDPPEVVQMRGRLRWPEGGCRCLRVVGDPNFDRVARSWVRLWAVASEVQRIIMFKLCLSGVGRMDTYCIKCSSDALRPCTESCELVEEN
jgi:hypothetical protein